MQIRSALFLRSMQEGACTTGCENRRFTTEWTPRFASQAERTIKPLIAVPSHKQAGL